MPRYRWIEPARTAAGTELASFGLLGDILAVRGFRSLPEARAFIDSGSANLPDPSTLPDIERAAARIRDAISRNERIAIFGDYDVDGITSTALAATVLRDLGAEVVTYLPHRDRDGYGLNVGAVERLRRDGCTLLITVDCGTGSRDEFKVARDHGIDAIVVDHHHVSDNNLPVTAFVSPRRPDSEHEFSDYAAVGVTYQLLRYLTDDRDMDRHLLLASVGTVADVVPLTGPNRTIVRRGLDSFAYHAGPGLSALVRESGLHLENITSHHLGFMLGPRINAAGRIDDPGPALQLLMTESSDEAGHLAKHLGQLNTLRQQLLEDAVEEAKLHVEYDGASDWPVIVVRSPSWNVGLVGLIASRLSEHYRRPAFVLEERGELSRGSARSIEEFNVVEALDLCEELLEQYGGHSKAAGLTIRTDRIEQFTRRINDVFVDRVGPVAPEPSLMIDAELRHDLISLDLIDEMSELEPFGSGNPTPVFTLKVAEIRDVRQSRNRLHLLFNVCGIGLSKFNAVCFGGGARLPELHELRHVDLALSLRRNTWRGQTSVTLEVVDFRPT